MHIHKHPETLKNYQDKIQKYFTEEYPRDLQWSRKLGVKEGFFKGIIIGITSGIVFSSYILDGYCAMGTTCQPWFYINTFNLIILIIINPLLIAAWTVFMPQELLGAKTKTIREPILITFFTILLSYLAYFFYVFAITNR